MPATGFLSLVIPDFAAGPAGLGSTVLVQMQPDGTWTAADPQEASALSDIYQALARTALLIELDIFGPGADHHAIIDGLRDTTARIVTDRANIDTPAGQTALVTLYALLAMQGLRIDPDVPATPMRSSQPPLRGTSLPASLPNLVRVFIW